MYILRFETSTMEKRKPSPIEQSTIWSNQASDTSPSFIVFFFPYECGLFASINRIPDFHPGHGMAISQSVNAYLRVSPPNLDIYLTMYLQSTGMKMIQKI